MRKITALDLRDTGYQARLPAHARSTATRSVKTNIRATELHADPSILSAQLKVSQSTNQRQCSGRAGLKADRPGGVMSRSFWSAVHICDIHKTANSDRAPRRSRFFVLWWPVRVSDVHSTGNSDRVPCYVEGDTHM